MTEYPIVEPKAWFKNSEGTKIHIRKVWSDPEANVRVTYSKGGDRRSMDLEGFLEKLQNGSYERFM